MSFNLHNSPWSVGATVVPILQMRELRLSFIACKWQSQILNPDQPGSRGPHSELSCLSSKFGWVFFPPNLDRYFSKWGYTWLLTEARSWEVTYYILKIVGYYLDGWGLGIDADKCGCGLGGWCCGYVNSGYFDSCASSLPFPLAATTFYSWQCSRSNFLPLPLLISCVLGNQTTKFIRCTRTCKV